MKTRHLLLALAALALVSTGMVWASADEAVPATTEPAAQPADGVDIETAEELLESIVPEAENKGACCVADCFDAFEQCTQGCGGIPCFQECRAELTACRSGC